MNIKLLAVASLASAALIGHVDAGGHHGGGGGGGGGGNFAGARPGMARGGAGPSFRSMPMGSYGGNRMMYSGQRFSPAGMRATRPMEFRSHPMNSNMGQFARGNMGVNRANQFHSNRVVQNGNGFARNNGAISNQHTGANQFHNGNNLAPNWHNHVVAQHSANWHHDWDHHHDHFFHGHRCCFINGSWFVFDAGFYPWWPWWWDWPSYGYGYGYPNGYGYGYGYDNGYGYGNGYGYDDSGAYPDQSGYQNGYGDQSANSSVAAAQDRLAQEGFYHGQIDGVVGPETRHAIVRFQTKHGLGISGELTRETLNAMGLRQYASGY